MRINLYICRFSLIIYQLSGYLIIFCLFWSPGHSRLRGRKAKLVVQELIGAQAMHDQY